MTRKQNNLYKSGKNVNRFPLAKMVYENENKKFSYVVKYNICLKLNICTIIYSIFLLFQFLC